MIGMSIFTSPALSTIELFAPVDKLPLAMALLTIVGNLVNALEPVIVDLIDYMGAAATFAFGGVAVFLSGYALKKTSLDLFKSSTGGEERSGESKKSRYGFILFLGIGLGFATSVLFNLFPDQLHKTLEPVLQMNGNKIIVGILILSAVMSLPLIKLVERVGLKKSFTTSLAITLSAIAGILTMSSVGPVILLCVVFAFGFTWMSVSSLPLVIQEASLAEKVFCVGIFYSGVALPDGVLDYLTMIQ